MSDDLQPLDLRIAHSWDGQPLGEDERVSVTLSPAPDGLALAVQAPLRDDPPPPGPPGPTWALWDYEVVELFIVGADQHYLEVEIGPHGHHLVLKLHGVRNIVARQLPLDVEYFFAAGSWTALTVIPAAYIPPGPHRINAFAIHGVGDTRRYLAHHPVGGDAPDFHRIDDFPPAKLPHPIP